MGLAASQARLLTITSRKADCEFQSMRYSHQKIALSRNMNDISNEYQNALEQTKLIYDYYGTGDASNPLTYGLMMTPSELNGHMPILTTDGSGKTVLNTQYAAAARAAGIPQEGLGCLPSTTIRNKFIQGMADAGLITPEVAATFQGIPYAQTMGVGSTDLVTTVTEKMTFKDLLDHYKQNGNVQLYDLQSGTLNSTFGITSNAVLYNGDKNSTHIGNSNCTIVDIIENDYQYILWQDGNDDFYNTVVPAITSTANPGNVWDWMFEELANMLNVTGNAQIAGAISYAEAMTRQILDSNNGYTEFKGSIHKNRPSVMNSDHTTMHEQWWDFLGGSQGAEVSTSDYIGAIRVEAEWGAFQWDPDDYASIDISNIAKTYLTYFAQYMEGGSRYSEYKIDESGKKVANSNFLELDDETFLFDVIVDVGVNTDQGLQSGFYDAMFNQICQNGWVENANVDDKNYLQEMLQNGMLFIATCSEDGFYYQGNYSTNTFIKEIVDEEAIARAEAKYNAEKQKINSKEEVIDMKMKNLDTEISSLTTEYDTVKSLLSKNIEKSFKRYDA